MAYKLAVKIAAKSACYNDPRKMQGPLGAMLHSVGCSQPSAENWANRWNSPTATVCATYVIEPNYVIQILPENKRPWTSGSGANGNANNYMFQAEMTEPACLQYQGGSAKFNVPADRLEEAQDFVTATYWTAVELYADRFKALGLDPTAMIPTKKHPTLISHAEGGAKYKVASNHGDPEHLWSQLKLPYTMDTFRRDVKLAMGATPTPPKAETVRLTAGTPYYKAPDGKTVVGKIEVTTNYTIVERSGKYGKLKSGAGWVKLRDDPAPAPSGLVDTWARANTLKQGSKGKHVEVLQALLQTKGYDVQAIDGSFGAVTDKQVRAYQKAQGITVDGIVGYETWPVVLK